MKKVNLILTLCALCMMMSSCVLIRGGVAFGNERYSYNNSDLANTTTSIGPVEKSALVDLKGSNSEVGFYLGLGLTGVEIADNFSFAPEINFISVKNLDEIQIPILVQYEIIDRLSAQAGPAVGFFMDSGNGLKSTTFGFDIGANYEIIDRLSAQARFDLGISNIVDGDFGKIRYNTLQFGLAYSF